MTHAAPIALLAALLAVSPAAAQVQGTAALNSGFDSNPSRLVGGPGTLDGFVSFTGTGRGRLALGDAHQLTGRYDLGLRKYFNSAGEDLAVQQAEAEYALRAGALQFGANLAGKLRLSRAADRDYRDGSATAWGEWGLADNAALRLTGGARGFVYPPYGDYDSTGPLAGFAGRYRPWRHLQLGASLMGAWLTYRGAARLSADGGAMSATRRRDRQWAAQATADYRGPLAAQLGYRFAAIESNSFGERAQRHRLSAALTTPIPGDCFLMVQGAYQFIRYPDGIYFSENYAIDVDEAQSSVEAKLAWPVNDAVDLELRYALFWIGFPSRTPGEPDRSFRREMGGLGVAVRL